MLRIFCICFFIFSYWGAWSTIIRLFLEHISTSAFSNPFPSSKEQRNVRRRTTKIRLQSVMPAFYAICCPGYPLSCCIVLVPHFHQELTRDVKMSTSWGRYLKTHRFLSFSRDCSRQVVFFRHCKLNCIIIRNLVYFIGKCHSWC